MIEAIEQRQDKLRAQVLAEQRDTALAEGDYREVRRLDAEIAAVAPDSDLARRAARQLYDLRVDAWAVVGGALTTLSLALAWVLSL